MQTSIRGLSGFASKYQIELGALDVGVQPMPRFADSGDVQYDLPNIFEEIGRAAKAANTGWCLLVDQVHILSKTDLSALITAFHRISQLQLPVLLFGMGLPKVARLAAEAKSYSERIFVYIKP